MVSLGPPLAHGPRAETPSDGAQLALIAGRLCSAEAAVEAVKPGNRVFVGTACATPIGLVQALERRKPVPPDVELFYFLTSGLEPLRPAVRLLPSLFLRRLRRARAGA